MKKRITDKRMLELLKYACDRDGITLEEACNKIGYNHTNIGKVKSGAQSFKIEQLLMADRLLKKVNYNWVFGKEDNMTTSTPSDPIETLKLAVKALEGKMRGR